MTTTIPIAASGDRLGFRVEGMDCASCVGKIETALERLPGLSGISVNFATETLTLSRDPASKTTAKDVAKKIRSLGFDVQELPATAVPSPAPMTAKGHDAHAGCGHGDAHGHDGCAGSHDHEGHGHKHAKHAGHNHDGGSCSGHGHEKKHDDHGSCGGHAVTTPKHAGHSHDHGGAACSGHDHGHAAVQPKKASATPPNASMKVEGMDCASCVGKIETALARMPGVSDVNVNFTTETLELRLDGASASRLAEIEKTVKSLGFGVTNSRLLSSDTMATEEPSQPAKPQRWWQTRKGKHVVGLGLLMGSAYGVAQFVPFYAEWIFAAAVLIGVVPFARKAFALATSGSPFSIETLMSVAAIGALVIGEAEEAAAVVFLFAVGELLESVAAGCARAGIRALASLVPKTAVLIDPNGGSAYGAGGLAARERSRTGSTGRPRARRWHDRPRSVESRRVAGHRRVRAEAQGNR